MTRAVSITVRLQMGEPDSPALTVHGREAWALLALIAAGERGCTPINTPGPRWSAYIHDLRKLGFAIETIRERHGGPFPGEHARYVLRSRVAVLEPRAGGAEDVARPAAGVTNLPMQLTGPTS
jgi:hypothetical protein